MPVIDSDSPLNPIPAIGRLPALIAARLLLLLMVTAATVIVVLVALSVVIYLGPVGSYFAAFVLVALALCFAMLALAAAMRASGLQIRLLGRRPVAAGIVGDDFDRYTRAATRGVKVWSRCAIAVVVVSVLAAGPQNFLPVGQPAFRHGHYLETFNTGAPNRIITRAAYEELNMANLRFAGLVSALMIVGFTRLLSGIVQTELRQ